jgi:hypothetical protein
MDGLQIVNWVSLIHTYWVAATGARTAHGSRVPEGHQSPRWKALTGQRTPKKTSGVRLAICDSRSADSVFSEVPHQNRKIASPTPNNL